MNSEALRRNPVCGLFTSDQIPSLLHRPLDAVLEGIAHFRERSRERHAVGGDAQLVTADGAEAAVRDGGLREHGEALFDCFGLFDRGCHDGKS